MYKKSHIITSSTTLTDYQIKLKVYYGSGIDSGDSVYLNSKCKSDFGDIRFIDIYGNKLSYWVESYTSSVSAVVWVKIPSIVISTTIWIYYGDLTLTSESNGSNTFNFFDDFSESTLNTSRWDYAGSPTVSSGRCVLTGTKTERIVSKSTFPVGYSIRSLFQMPVGYFCGMGWRDAPTYNPNCSFYANYPAAGAYNAYTYTSGVEVSKNLGSSYTGDHIWELKRPSTASVIYDIDNITKATLTPSIPSTSLSVFFIIDDASANLNVNWVLVRKCAVTEPVHSTWGFETFVGDQRIGGTYAPALLDKCILHFTGQRCSTLLGDIDEFPILPSGVTVTNNGTFTKTDLGNNKSVLNFDGSTNYISLTDNDAWAMFEGDFTIIGWFRFPNRSQHHPILLQAPHGGAYWQYLVMSNGNIQLTGYAVDGSTTLNFYYYYYYPTVDNVWYHISIQRYGTTCLAHVNGISQTVTTGQAWRNTSNFASPLIMGANIPYSYYINGNIKDLMIFKGRALTQPEIKLLMQLTNPNTGREFELLYPGQRGVE